MDVTVRVGVKVGVGVRVAVEVGKAARVGVHVKVATGPAFGQSAAELTPIMSPCCRCASTALSSTTMNSHGFFSDPVRWQIPTFPVAISFGSVVAVRVAGPCVGSWGPAAVSIKLQAASPKSRRTPSHNFFIPIKSFLRVAQRNFANQSTKILRPSISWQWQSGYLTEENREYQTRPGLSSASHHSRRLQALSSHVNGSKQECLSGRLDRRTTAILLYCRPPSFCGVTFSPTGSGT